MSTTGPLLDVHAVVKRLGGTTRAAVFFEVTPSAVSQWKRRGSLPKAKVMYLRVAKPEVYSAALRG
jgi:hypothetical protein